MLMGAAIITTRQKCTGLINPFAFVAFVAHVCGQIKNIVTYLDDLEEQMQDSVPLRDLWRTFRWPVGQFERTQMLRLRQENFERLGRQVSRARDLAADAMVFSTHVEDGGNKLRSRENAHQSHMMSMQEKYHQLQAKPILNNYDREPCMIDDRAKLAAPHSLPKAAFKADVKHKSSFLGIMG